MLLGVLLLLAVPIGLVQAQDASPVSIGTAVISDSARDSEEATNGTITYILTGLTPPPADKALEGWLVSDDGSVKLSTGVIEIAADGSVHHRYTSPTGEDLIAGYDKVVITEEPVPDDDPGPSDVVLYSHTVPPGAMAHIRHLVSSGPPGGPNGILTHLKEQLDVAITHANLASNSTTIEAVQSHTHHVINILEGSEGPNYDASFGDPGDAFGAINHAIDRKHGPFAAGGAPNDDVVVGGAALVDTNGMNAQDWATLARDTAVDKVLTADIAVAKVFLGPGAGSVISSLEAARHGFDTDQDGTIESIAGEGGAQQAFIEAQKMATYTLTPGAPAAVVAATPAPSDIETPATGDTSIPRLARLGLIAGLVLLAAGSMLLVRSRRSRIRA